MVMFVAILHLLVLCSSSCSSSSSSPSSLTYEEVFVLESGMRESVLLLLLLLLLLWPDWNDASVIDGRFVVRFASGNAISTFLTPTPLNLVNEWSKLRDINCVLQQKDPSNGERCTHG